MDSSIRLYNTEKYRHSATRNYLQDQQAEQVPEEQGVCISSTHKEEVLVDAAPAAPHASSSPVEHVDVADFEAIFQRFQVPIINFIYHLIGNREQACDLAQDVFVKAYKALLGGTVVQPGALSAWLYRIAANTTTDSLRRRRLISWLPLSMFSDDRGIGAGILAESGNASSDGFNNYHEDSANHGRAGAAAVHDRGSYDGGQFENRVADREIIERVLKRLPHKYTICLWLYENNGLSCAEIAEVLRISSSAVKMRLMRARERFVGLYRQEVGDT